MTRPTNADVYKALKYNITIDRVGTRRYYDSTGQLHRDDGPAVEYADGVTAWYQNNLLHRTDGPAVEWKNGGGRIWFMNGQKHRLDGPAVEYPNGCRLWYLYGVEYEVQEFHDKLTQYGFAK